MSYGRGSGGPRSTRHLLGPTHRAGGGGNKGGGCRLIVLAFVAAPAAIALAGWGAGALYAAVT